MIAGCSGPNPGNPPSYQACTPPARSTGFTAADWTAVVNQMLAEIYAAGQVVSFFGDLDSMRQSLFIAEGAELPAIGGNLGLQAAAGSTATYNMNQMWSVIFGLAGSLAGPAEPEVSALLWVASEIASAVPSASPTATSSFSATYAGLQDQFTQMVTEIDVAMGVQNRDVRADAGLLGLVAQLRSRGTWNVDLVGMKSTGRQGFATWVYRALMPTVYDRWNITNCRDHWNDDDDNVGSLGKSLCGQLGAQLGVIGGGQSFITLSSRMDWSNGVPCHRVGIWGDWGCDWTPPNDLIGRIWAQPSDDCIYQPGMPETAWTFSCSVGVDETTSVGANTWGFPSWSGNPEPNPNSPDAAQQAIAAQVRARPPITLGRARHGSRRAVGGRATLSAAVSLPPRLRLAGATVKVDRLLFEHRGHQELTRPHGRGAPRPLTLTLKRRATGRFSAAATSGHRRVRVGLRRQRGRASLELAISGRRPFRAPRACHGLPARIALASAPLHLQSRLVIGDGRTRHRVLLEHRVRCARDARGNVSRLRHVRNRSYPARPGMAVTLRGPRRVQPGNPARYVMRVRNRRRGADRLLSSLWDVRLNTGRPRKTEIRELRRGRSRTLRFTRSVPRIARERFCTVVVTTAPGARAARARVCAQVGAARAPSVTG